MSLRSIPRAKTALPSPQLGNEGVKESSMAKHRKTGYCIAHFGDLHLRSPHGDFRNALAMLDDAVQNGADHLVFSGDILDDADAGVLKSFVRELRARNLAHAAAVTVVPGNHDIFPTCWPPTWRSFARTIFRTAQLNFERFARLTAWSRHGVAADELFANAAYPFAKSLSNDVVIVGLDTTINENRRPTSWAAGELAEEDINVVEKFFQKRRNAVHRIVVMHHYPFADFKNVHPWVNMKFEEPDAATVRNWLGWANATLVLCGHIHNNRDRRSADGFRVICTDSVSTYADGKRHHEGLCYRLIELHATGRVSVTDQVVEAV
jgi:3',5'-cyclic AMP phosphodiesterase CpdA